MSARMSGSVQLGLRVSKPDRSNLMLRRDLGLAPPAPGSKMSRTLFGGSRSTRAPGSRVGRQRQDRSDLLGYRLS
jgi:hypothetical protein